MRSRGSRPMRSSVMLAMLLLLGARPLPAQQAQTSGERAPITRADIVRAVEQVKDDPNLSAERTIRMLRWTSSPSAPDDGSRLLDWIAGLFRWVAETARVLVWVAAVLLAGLLIVWLSRRLQPGASLSAGTGSLTPTHVRDLDIRPESLPRDIGATARDLWDRGEHRAALALLYRGLLSRLAHVHHVGIRDSTTEGDCLALAAAHLTPDRHAFAARLVRAWQRGVYGGQVVDAATVHALCAQFAAALDSADVPAAVAIREAAAEGRA